MNAMVALLNQKSMLKQTLDLANDAFVVCDEREKIVLWSDGAVKMLGWCEADALHRTLSDILVPERLRERHRAGFRRFLETRQPRIIQQRISVQAMHRDGYEKPIELKVSALDIDGQLHLSAAMRETLFSTDLRAAGNYPVALLDLADEAMIACDVRLKIIFWNNGAERLYGYSRSEALGRFTYELLQSSYPIALDDLRAHLWNNACWQGEITHRDADGKAITVLSKWALEYDTHGEPMHILVSNTNITQTKDYLRRVEFLATHDDLTKLPNRELLRTRLNQAISNATDRGNMMAVMFLDLNRFKVVNDSLGHQQGDLLLTVIAQRLLNVVKDGDTVARIGGDEFVICLHKVDDVGAITEIGERVLRAVCQPISLRGQDAVVSTSIGVSIYPRDGSDATTLIEHADMAMYQSKTYGQGYMQFYSEELNARALDRFQMENALRAAIAAGEFEILYQPIVEAQTTRIVSVEALIRWNHPDKGYLLPADFIPLAEEIDLIGQIGEWVIQKVVRQMGAWRESGLAPQRVSINISPRQLRTPGFIEDLTLAIDEATFIPDCLEIEITESALMENIEEVEKTLTQIRQLGILLAIDDFGTGYSSLSHLKKLPIDTLKIDGSFINNLCCDADDDAIVTATIGLAKTMKLRVVAEGVTTKEQADLLTGKGCNALQGFYFSKPLDAASLSELLSRALPKPSRSPSPRQ